MAYNVNVVIGSWGSYNECNERVLGSKWLTLNNYNDWDEIIEELTKEGFDLKGIDEELFIQDYEGFDGGFSCDSMHPRTLFEILQNSGVLEHENQFEKMEAFIEVRDWDEFASKVEEKGTNWDDEIYLWKNYSLAEYGEEKMKECYTIPDYLDRYIDYELFGQDDKDNGYIEEYSGGLIEIAY